MSAFDGPRGGQTAQKGFSLGQPEQSAFGVGSAEAQASDAGALAAGQKQRVCVNLPCVKQGPSRSLFTASAGEGHSSRDHDF